MVWHASQFNIMVSKDMLNNSGITCGLKSSLPCKTSWWVTLSRWVTVSQLSIMVSHVSQFNVIVRNDGPNIIISSSNMRMWTLIWNRTRPRAPMLNQQTSARKTSHKHNNKDPSKWPREWQPRPTSLFTHLLSSSFMFLFKWCLMSSDVDWHIGDKLSPVRAWAWFNISLRPRKPWGSLGRTA